MRPLRFSWGMFYVFLFLYRSMFSVFTELVVMRLTNIGDTRTYLKAIFLTNLLNVILDLLLIFGLFRGLRVLLNRRASLSRERRANLQRAMPAVSGSMVPKSASRLDVAWPPLTSLPMISKAMSRPRCTRSPKRMVDAYTELTSCVMPIPGAGFEPAHPYG